MRPCPQLCVSIEVKLGFGSRYHRMNFTPSIKGVPKRLIIIPAGRLKCQRMAIVTT